MPSVTVPSTITEPLPIDLVLGNLKSKVVLIEYSSLSCPHCAEFHRSVFPELKERYIDTGKIGYIYRDFPTNHAGFLAAKLTFCAKQNRLSWIEILLSNQDKWVEASDLVSALQNIAELGDITDTNKCLDDKNLEQQIIDRAYQAHNEYMITSVPAFFINNKRAEQVYDKEDFLKLIEDNL